MSPERSGAYPPAEPYDRGLLDVGDGNAVFWEVSGSPEGKPALVLHGGPGSGCTPWPRRLFDPGRYRVVLLDQRGCGRSTPHAADRTTELAANTTQHLLADIELVRQHLGVERWLVFGNSWGSTLALAYAQTHPERVSEVVLLAVTTSTPAEIEWLYHGAGRFFPEAWDRFCAAVPANARRGDLVGAYHRLLDDPDPAVRDHAAVEWCRWEAAVVATPGATNPNPRYDNARFRMAFARIVTHYFVHHAWLEPGALLAGAARLHGIPGVLVHGRLDISAPLATAWHLARAWAGSELVVTDAGHVGSDPAMVDAVVAATDRFARR